MATMTQAQITAELKRKASLGIAPTNSANQAQYNSIAKSIKSSTPTSGLAGVVKNTNYSGGASVVKNPYASVNSGPRLYDGTGGWSSPGPYEYEQYDPNYQPPTSTLVAPVTADTYIKEQIEALCCEDDPDYNPHLEQVEESELEEEIF